MDKRARLDTYKTQYDIDIVVANKYVTLEDLKKDYVYGDGSEVDDAILDGCGTTATCRNIHTDALVLLVKYNRNIRRKDIDKFLDMIDTAVHESMHVLLHMYQECNVKIQYDNQEPVCYDIGKIVTYILKIAFKQMTDIEFNAILYYADFLSLKHENHPVTDNCKYFFIHGCPINSAYILDLEPEYDENNLYISQALEEYQLLADKYDNEAALSFIDEISCIKACGCVDAETMLKCIHQFSTKYERKLAFAAYNRWKKEQFYSHITFNENGDPQETPCTRYFYHAERRLKRHKLLASFRSNRKSIEEQP